MKSATTVKKYLMVLLIGTGITAVLGDEECDNIALSAPFPGTECQYARCTGNCDTVSPYPITCVKFGTLGTQKMGVPYTNTVTLYTTTGAYCTCPQAGMVECYGGTDHVTYNYKQKEQPCEDCGG
jgi:hypothetical protein